MTEPSDTDLVRGAQDGNIGCLSLLLARHEAGMRAVALGILGHRSEVDDVVQESCLVAVRRIGDVREPEAVGGWLRAVVRNQCRMLLRARTAIPVDDLDLVVKASDRLDPAELIEQRALGDWIWHAVNELAPELQLVTMLRYFSGVTTYAQIAAVCGIPVGTVRSRLSIARARLTENLTAGADLAHGDHRAVTQARHQQADQVLAAIRTGQYGKALSEVLTPDTEMVWGKGERTHGLDYPIAAMRRDVNDGVGLRLTEVVTGRDTEIWEMDLINPADNPFHCPPSAVWVHSLQPGPGGRAYWSRLFHPVLGPMPHPGLDPVDTLSSAS